MATSLRVFLCHVLASSLVVGVGCGGSEAEDLGSGSAVTGAGGAIAAGTGGSTAGIAGASGAGMTSSAGVGGASGASGGAGKPAGSGGVASGGGGATSGNGGAPAGGVGGTSGGSAGVGGVGAASGAAGAAGGGSGKCTDAASCPAISAVPAGCAEAFCDAGTCRYRSRDADQDGYRSNVCSPAVSGQVILLGDDCDDKNAATNPKGWDGPAGDGHPNACADGVDQDCTGVDGDGSTVSGATCTCTPGDVAVCSQRSNGQPIVFPGGSPVGECKSGSKSCLPSGIWSPCTGAIEPTAEICNGKDDDCDGKADMEDVDTPPLDVVKWTYDGDGDGFSDAKNPAGMSVKACSNKPPTVCPASVVACSPAKWTLGNLTPIDCDDADAAVAPGSTEICNGKDDDCSGEIDDSYAANASIWSFDYDGDNQGDSSIPSVRACSPPPLPSFCASLSSLASGAYCTGLPQEAAAPTCPAKPCDVSMWKKGLPNTDCKDHPDGADVKRGNKPELVYQGATDLCSGRDYNCDGSPDTGCGCAPVGVEETCGSADTCNLGIKKCLSGGTWGACGPEKAKLDYCPDDDGDKYCNLLACINRCPGDLPADGHLYIEKSTCTGYTQPNNAGTDCLDTDKTANPGILAEICNGDDKDHNCNGIPNTPGQSDCECVDSAVASACNPPNAIYPGNPQPGAPLKGECAWGQRTCSLGVWSACTGGLGALATEDCSKADGKDRDCDGSTNTVECGCVFGGPTQACGCAGTQTCLASGQWGTCAGEQGILTYCTDKDSDKSCLNDCAPACSASPPANKIDRALCAKDGQGSLLVDCADTDAARAPTKPELCGSGKDENCDAGQQDSDGFGLGATCSPLTGQGACVSAGKKACNGPNGTTCAPNTGIGATACRSSTAPNGSWDWDCNGTNTVCTVEQCAGGCYYYFDAKWGLCKTPWEAQTGCGTKDWAGGVSSTAFPAVPPANSMGTIRSVDVGYIKDACGSLFTEPTCTGASLAYAVCSGAECASPCGREFWQVDCEWNSNTNQCDAAFTKYKTQSGTLLWARNGVIGCH